MLSRLSVSKWLKMQVLLDPVEMRAAFIEMSPFELYNVSSMGSLEELKISQEMFLEAYEKVVSQLKEGQIPEPDRKIFSAVATCDPTAIHFQEVRPGKWMAKLVQPMIQFQYHRFLASTEDSQIHSMVLSSSSVHWGVQLAFPQIFLGSDGSYTKTAQFPNAALFSKWTKWLRAHSVPTTFIFKGAQIGTPIRLGKKCFEWIDNHPQLKAQCIQVRHF